MDVATELFDFVDLQHLIDGKVLIANGRARGSVSVAGGDGELLAGALHGVDVAVALGAGHCYRVRGNQLVERSTVPIANDVGALGLRDLQQIASHTGKADGLRGRRALVAAGHLFQIEVIQAAKQRSCNEEASQSSHGLSLPPRPASCKTTAKTACATKQQRSFFAAAFAPLLDFFRCRAHFPV